MTPFQALLVVLVARYLPGLLDPIPTLREAQRLMYFLIQSGEPLRLRFQKGYDGPFTEDLFHEVGAMAGHFIVTPPISDGTPDMELELAPGASEEATVFLENHPDTRARFNRVSDLVEGFETSYGLELLSAVHWVVQNERVRNLGDVIRHTHAWNSRKQRFNPRQIGIAVDTLAGKGWIPKMQ